MGLDKVEVELRLIQLLCKSEGLRLKISDQPFKIENKLLQLQSTESLQFSVQEGCGASAEYTYSRQRWTYFSFSNEPGAGK